MTRGQIMQTSESARHTYHHGDLRKALIEAAEAELAEKGVEGFTLRGCAKRAGVSHAAPAHHFKDANALLTALAVVAAERLYDSMERRHARAEKTPRAQFIASGVGYVEFALANPALFRLMFSSDRPDASDESLHRQSGAAFMVLVGDVAALTGGRPHGERCRPAHHRRRMVAGPRRSPICSSPTGSAFSGRCWSATSRQR